MAKTRAEVNLRLFDASALIDAEYTAPDIQPFSDLDDLKVDFDPPYDYATLEPNQWMLDGSMKIFPDDMSTIEVGYWSLSQSDALMALNVPMSINFDNTHSTIGITFIFYPGDYATDIDISWYDASDDLIIAKNFLNDRNVFFADEAVIDYKRVEVVFNKNNKAEHYIKLSQIGFGADIIFTEDDIKQCQIVEELNTVSNEISINTMTLNVLIRDSDYISKIYKVLQDQQKLITSEYVNDVKKEMGTFYLKTRKNPNENSIQFTCEDFLGVMANETYLGGIVNDTVENILNNIFGTYGTSLFTISDDIKNLVVSGYIPITDYRRAIQLVAFSVNAVVDCSRSNKVNIYRLSTISPQDVDKSRYFRGSSQQELKKVTGASLNLQSYTVGSGTTEVYKVTHIAGTYQALFNAPFTSLSISGGSIDSSGDNYVIFTTTGGLVTITGTPYNISNQVFLIEKPNILPTETENTIKFQNSLLWDGIQNLQYIYDHLINLNERKVKLLLETEKAGNFVSVDALYGEKIEGYVESMKIDLSGGFIGETTIVGVIV